MPFTYILKYPQWVANGAVLYIGKKFKKIREQQKSNDPNCDHKILDTGLNIHDVTSDFMQTSNPLLIWHIYQNETKLCYHKTHDR